MEKITIIVPVYNIEEYIEDCIKSILEQTYTNLDIILVDDGSTDKSGDICEKYKLKDDRVTVIHQKNQGLSVARNTGLSLAKGDLIQFVDGDDFIDKNMIEDLHRVMKEQSADIVTCSHYIYENGQVVEKQYSNKIHVYNNKKAIKQLILDKEIRFYAWDKLYKKSLWDDISFPVGRRFEDIATTPKVFIKAKKIVYYDSLLYYYRKRNGSIMTQRTREQKLEYIQSILEMNHYLRNNISQIESYLDYNIVHATLNIFHSIGKYKLEELKNEKIVVDLYKRAKQIMSNEKQVEFINKCCHNTKRVHLYYLMSDEKEYINNLNYLPSIYKTD